MTSTSTCTYQTPNNVQGRYGFAKLDDDIVLVQLVSSPAPRSYQAHVFRHDFVSVFSYSHTQMLGLDLLEILENDENPKLQCWLEEDTATVFVTQDVMTRFISLMDMLVPRMGIWRMYRRPDERSLDSGSSLATTII